MCGCAGRKHISNTHKWAHPSCTTEMLYCYHGYIPKTSSVIGVHRSFMCVTNNRARSVPLSHCVQDRGRSVHKDVIKMDSIVFFTIEAGGQKGHVM